MRFVMRVRSCRLVILCHDIYAHASLGAILGYLQSPCHEHTFAQYWAMSTRLLPIRDCICAGLRWPAGSPPVNVRRARNCSILLPPARIWKLAYADTRPRVRICDSAWEMVCTDWHPP